MDNSIEDLKEIAGKAREHIKARKFDLALSLCEEVESLGPKSAEIFALHAEALGWLERWQEASNLIYEKLEEYPADPSLINALAFLGNRRGNYKYTLDVCDWAASINVSSSKLSINKSAALIRLGRYEEAIHFIKQELKKYPDEEGLYQNLSVAIGGTRRHDLALSACEEAELKGLESAGLQAARCFALVGLKRWQEASNLIEEKLQEYPNDPTLYLARAYLSFKRRKYKEAIAICDKAASIGLPERGFVDVKSASLIRTGRLKEARNILERELEENDDPALHVNLAAVYRATFNFNKSKQEHERARELAPALVKRVRKKRLSLILGSVFIILAFLIIGWTFFPSSGYYWGPLWLLFIALYGRILFQALRDKRIAAAVISFVVILIFGFLGYTTIFHPSFHFEDTSIHFSTSNTSEADYWASQLKDNDPETRESAARWLVTTGGSGAVDALMGALGDSDSKVRATAAQGLGKIGDSRAVEPLIQALGDDDADVRHAVAMALSNLRDARGVEPIITALYDGGDVSNYIGDLAQDLSQIGAPAVEPLIVGLSATNLNIRWGCAQALGLIGDPRAVPALIETLKDEDASVRICAARALGAIGEASAVPALNQAQNDEDASVREAAAEALEKIKNK